jgi:hypothetical protein
MANPILSDLQAKLDRTEARDHPVEAPSDRDLIRAYRDPVTGMATMRPLDTPPPVFPPKDSVSVPRNDFNATLLKLLIAMDDKLNRLLEKDKRKPRCGTSSPQSSGVSGS